MEKIINWITDFLKNDNEKSSRRLAFISNSTQFGLMVFIAFIYLLVKNEFKWLFDLLESFKWYVLGLGGFVIVDYLKPFKKNDDKID
jgi:hypothetical protein